jgi:hypothetical protein
MFGSSAEGPVAWNGPLHLPEITYIHTPLNELRVMFQRNDGFVFFQGMHIEPEKRGHLDENVKVLAQTLILPPYGSSSPSIDEGKNLEWEFDLKTVSHPGTMNDIFLVLRCFGEYSKGRGWVYRFSFRVKCRAIVIFTSVLPYQYNAQALPRMGIGAPPSTWDRLLGEEETEPTDIIPWSGPAEGV